MLTLFFRLSFAAAIVISIASGCGESAPKGVKVTGSVTMGGQGQQGARVSFIPSAADKDATSKGAVTNAEGKFETILVPGKYSVLLSRMVDKNGQVPGNSEDPALDYAQLEAGGALREMFPPKYTATASTPLSVEIPPSGKDLEPFTIEK